MEHRDEFGQPVGFPVQGWERRPIPPRSPLHGRYCRLEPLDPARHADELFEAFAEDDGRMWAYMSFGPFATPADCRAWAEAAARGDDPLFHAIVGPDGRAAGVASYLRIDPANGVIEIGSIAFPPRLQRTREATEAIHLMMRRAFDELGYRRCEWKCNALNTASRRAAERFGFAFEGVFRQAMLVRGRNRDTAWYALLDHEWPAVRAAFGKWLDPANFDADGRQIESLAAPRG